MDVAASEFYDNKAKTYDLNFKEEVFDCWLVMVQVFFMLHISLMIDFAAEQ